MIGNGTERSSLANLHLALEPRDVYAALMAVAPSLLGAEPRGAYLVEGDVNYVRDDAAGFTSIPERWNDASGLIGAGLLPVPYSFRDRPMGALVFDQDAPIDVESVRRTLEAHFAPALFRASWLMDALESEARTQDQLHFLLEMGKLLGRIDLEPLLASILGLICEFLSASIGSVVLRGDDGRLQTRVHWGLPLSALQELELREGPGLIEQALSSPDPRIFSADDLVAPAGGGLPERILFLPLVTSSGVLGFVACVADAENPRMNRDMLDIVRPAVGLAATAIENACLVQVKIAREKEHEQLALARRIQAGLLPSAPPPVEGIDIAATSVTANLIGGDYYDYFMLPDGTLGLLVADVAGKGVPAGLIMTAARATFRATAMDSSCPAEILTRVNRTLAEEEFGGRFVTACVARVDLENGILTVSSAAHEPLMLRRGGTGMVQLVGRPSLPLGVLIDTVYANLTVEIHSGDAFVLYTDGVTEAMDPARKLLGRDALQTAIAGWDGDARSLRQCILDLVSTHMGAAPRHDDTTMIAARIL